MTIALAIALSAAVGVIGAQVAFGFWQARRAANASDELVKELKTRTKNELTLAARQRAIADRDEAINNLEVLLSAEEAARGKAEKQRDNLLKEALADNPSAAAIVIRDALARVRKLSETDPTAAAEDPQD